MTNNIGYSPNNNGHNLPLTTWFVIGYLVFNEFCRSKFRCMLMNDNVCWHYLFTYAFNHR